MIDRQSCYKALFKLKNSGVDISSQLKIMELSRGVPREVVLFLRDNSPQFQFYRYIQKHQKTLAKSLLDFDELSNEDKIIVGSSFVTRVFIAIKYKEFSQSLLDDLDVYSVSKAVTKAIESSDYSQLDKTLSFHQKSLRLFYETQRKEEDDRYE